MMIRKGVLQLLGYPQNPQVVDNGMALTEKSDLKTDEDKEKKSSAVETQAKNKGEAKDAKEKDTQNKVVERAKEKAGKVVDQGS